MFLLLFRFSLNILDGVSLYVSRFFFETDQQQNRLDSQTIKLTDTLRYFIIRQMIEEVVTVLKNNQADKGASVSLRSGKFLEKRIGDTEFKYNSQENILTGRLASSISEQKIQKITQQLQKKGVQAQLEAALETGGVFRDYGELDNVFGDGKTKLAHTPGEVLLVDVWATWCGPCQKPMKHNQQMLEKNEAAWNGKAKIVGVSVDNEKETIRKRVTDRKWERITHLTLLGWKNDHQLIKDYKIQGIPFVCLVNKWGKVDFIGHPSEIDLQKRINQLIAQTQDKSLQPKAAAAAQSNEKNIKKEIEQLRKSLDKELIQKELKEVEFAIIKFLQEDKFQKDATSSHFSVSAVVIEGDVAAEEAIRKLFQHHKALDLKVQKVPYVNVPHVAQPNCSLCAAVKLQYPFYWLKWEGDNKFGCRTCVEKKSTIPEHHYQYQKNSVLLFGDWKKVGQKHLGNNLQPVYPKDAQQSFAFGCNGCGGCSEDVGNARYICLGCRSDPNSKAGGWVDLCDVCAYKLCEKDAHVQEKLVPDGHKPDHPLLRLLYSVKGYYDY